MKWIYLQQQMIKRKEWLFVCVALLTNCLIELIRTVLTQMKYIFDDSILLTFVYG